MGKGGTRTLTTGIDALTGTSGNDTFIGSFDGGATSTSNLGDSIDGGAGTDTVRIVSNAANTVVPTLSNVEKLHLVDTVHETRDVSGIAGLTSLELDSGTAAAGGGAADTQITLGAGQSLTLDSVTDATANADVANQEGIDIASATAVTSLGLTVDGVGAQTGADASNDLDLDITGNGVATANVTAVGTNNISLANAGGALTTVNVDGEGALNVWGQTAASINTFNAADNSGGVVVDLSASTSTNQTITGGSGNDSLTVDLARNITLDAGTGDDVVTLANPTAGNLSSVTGSADSIQGGEGTDTLAVTAAGAAALAGDTSADRGVISGFEQLRTTTDLNASTFNISNLGVNYLQVGADTTTADATVSGFTSGATIENRASSHLQTITVGGTTEVGDVVAATVNGTQYTFTATAGTNANAADGLAGVINTALGAGSVTGNSDGTITSNTVLVSSVSQTDNGAASQTINLATDSSDIVVGMTGATGAGTPDDTLNLKLNANLVNNAQLESSYQVDGINKLNVTTADRTNADGATGRDEGYVLNLDNDNNVSQITVDGDRSLSFTSTGETAALSTFNASALTGDLTVNLATNGLTQGATVTGGAGTNNITGTGFADIIVGGDRADTIVGGNGADKLTGNGGADIFQFALNAGGASSTGGSPAAGSFDSISDFASASDVIDFDVALTLSGDASATASVGNAALNAEGFASFNAADDTLAEKVAAVNAALNAGTPVNGEIAIFEDSGNTYVFGTDTGNAAVDANDALIELTGVTGLSDTTLAGGDLTIA